MKIKQLLQIIVLACLILSCTNTFEQEIETQDLGFTTTVGVATNLAFPTGYPTQTTRPTRSTTPTFTTNPLITSTALITTPQPCFSILNDLPQHQEYPGSIIFVGEQVIENLTDWYYKAAYYDSNTRQFVELGPDKVKFLEVSPDGTKFAAVDAFNDRINIYSQSGQLLKTVPEGEYPYGIDHWLSDEMLALVVLKPMEGTDYYWYPFEQVVYNIKTEEQTYLQSDYPDIDKALARMTWEGISTTKYDASLTRVVYPAVLERNNSGGIVGYVLWDLENKVKLLEFPTGQFSTTPKWAPDGSKFVINDDFGSGEFYVITRNGMVTQVSFMNSTNAGEDDEFRYYSTGYNWSPDGQYIAFWRESIIESKPQATLAILDTYTSSILETCISAGNVTYGVIELMPPVWSLDGNQLVLITNWQDSSHFDTVMVDLQDRFAARIGEALWPVGWLADPLD